MYFDWVCPQRVEKGKKIREQSGGQRGRETWTVLRQFVLVVLHPSSAPLHLERTSPTGKKRPMGVVSWQNMSIGSFCAALLCDALCCFVLSCVALVSRPRFSVVSFVLCCALFHPTILLLAFMPLDVNANLCACARVYLAHMSKKSKKKKNASLSCPPLRSNLGPTPFLG